MMKSLIIILLFLLVVPTGCDIREREKKLEQKEAQLNQKEQELLLKEKTLSLKEEDLLKRELKLDSSSLDSAAAFNPALVGRWSVQMTCTETTCHGSAVGDTRTEQWYISYQGNQIISKVIVNNNLSRVYIGIYTGNTLELVENVDATPTQPATKIVVRLRFVSDTKMEGQREIERGNECKIIYSMQLDKKV